MLDLIIMFVSGNDGYLSRVLLVHGYLTSPSEKMTRHSMGKHLA